MPSKYKVGREYRTSDLSHQTSSYVLEANMSNGTTKIYDNVHYPEKFARTMFSRHADITSILVKDLSDSSSTTINREDLGF